MFGYTTERQAKAKGFTHHGAYYGVPLWVKNDGDDDYGLVVEAKWYPMELVVSAFMWIEGFMRAILFPDDDPMFQFSIIKEIKP